MRLVCGLQSQSGLAYVAFTVAQWSPRSKMYSVAWQCAMKKRDSTSATTDDSCVAVACPISSAIFEGKPQDPLGRQNDPVVASSMLLNHVPQDNPSRTLIRSAALLLLNEEELPGNGPRGQQQ